MDKTDSITAAQAESLWTFQSVWFDPELPENSATFVTVYLTRAAAVATAEEILDEIRAEGNPGEASERHQQAEFDGQVRSIWYWDGEASADTGMGTHWHGIVQPLVIGQPIG